ncbi:hypothetical protein ABK040_013712 [Willaertia magna]
MLEDATKRRKIIGDSFISVDILYEIVKYFKNIKDYINLAQINKYCYNVLLLTTHEMFTNLFNTIMENNFLILENNLPDYLFSKLENLTINFTEDHLNKLNLFTNLKHLKISHKQSSIDNDSVVQNISKYNLFHNNILLKEHLQSLNICGSIFRDEDIQDFINLTKLNITNVKLFKRLDINGDLKDEDFYNLKNLKYLSLYSINTLNGNCFTYLNKLVELKCELKNIKELKYLQNIKQLTILKIANETTDKDLQNLTNIVNLNLEEFGQVTLNCLLTLENLKILNLCDFYSIEDKYFRNLKNLTSLFLQNSTIIEENLFRYLQNLKQLYLNKLNINDKYLLPLKKLEVLSIYDCKNITGECLLNFIELKELYLNRTNIKEEYLQNLINTEVLNIVNCPNLIIGKFLLNMKSLQYLLLKGEHGDSNDNKYKHFTKSEIKNIKILIKENKLTLKEIK